MLRIESKKIAIELLSSEEERLVDLIQQTRVKEGELDRRLEQVRQAKRDLDGNSA